MDNSAANIDPLSTLATRSGDGGVARGYGLPFSVSDLIQAPLSALLEYSGILRRESNQPENERLIGERFVALSREPVNESVYGTGEGEVSIRIIGLGDQENPRTGAGTPQPGAVSMGRAGDGRNTAVYSEVVGASLDGQEGMQVSHGDGVDLSPSMTGYTTSSSSSSAALHGANGEGGSTGVSDRDSTYQSYDVQQAARWIEPVLPFSLLLLLVFIRQHFQDFLITIWLAAVMFKSNDIVRKQTALKGERRIFILVGITLIFVLHVGGVYWWYKNGDLFYPLVMLPPKDIPPFWHAIFIILVNDTIVRQAAMIVKCILLMYYKNTRGRNYHKQGQLLTLVEYLVLLYRSLLPAPVWYRFFLNKEYGSLFSSLTTGLYLTFKLTSVVGKIQSFLAAIKALSGKELPYGSHASAEQVIAVGDLCTICQERMHAPILLCCKHIFCEDCVSEWFERERSCPICRALVRPAGIRSFGDSSTSLFFQIF